MVDKEVEAQLKDWSDNVHKMKENLTNFADSFLSDFTDEEKALIDKELAKTDNNDFGKSLDEVMSRLNDEFAKMK